VKANKEGQKGHCIYKIPKKNKITKLTQGMEEEGGGEEEVNTK